MAPDVRNNNIAIGYASTVTDTSKNTMYVLTSLWPLPGDNNATSMQRQNEDMKMESSFKINQTGLHKLTVDHNNAKKVAPERVKCYHVQLFD